MRRILLLLSLPLVAWCASPHHVNAVENGATPADQITRPDGFEIDLVYEVPASEQGSWVNLTVDPKGRLICSDQYGGLYRIDVSGPEAEVSKLDVDIVGAQGLLCAFGSLYVNINSNKTPPGIWRLTDTNGDDQYDKTEHILPLKGGGEHGPHAMIVSPDGNRIIMCAGNNTDVPDVDRSRVPRNWSEDHLLGRMPDALGHNAGRLAPGGFILSLNPDGSDVELIATGFRNEYDIALNRDGELFAFDADMEWDVGTPWYRPTRVNHVISGAEFGWRNGTGKWPAYYPDSFGAAVRIGAGSPTGICFGYGTKFPKKYQEALWVCDWSYGNIHVVHLAPDGSSYVGDHETFATAAPLPVTDIVVHPDGSMYFTVGGRRTQSALYRIRYTGDLDADDRVAADDSEAKELRKVRSEIEAGHVGRTASTYELGAAFDYLNHDDRAIRFAARLALEHQPVRRWREDALQLSAPRGRILGVIALARNGTHSDKPDAIAALTDLNWDDLSADDRIALVRAYALVALRLGGVAGNDAEAVLKQLGDRFPTGDDQVDRELAQLLVYLNAPGSTAKIVEQMTTTGSQEDQMHYAFTLRNVTEGWTPELHRRYFQWFNDFQGIRGGMSFGGFVNNIKSVALTRTPDDIKESLDDVINAPISKDVSMPLKQRDLVEKWNVDRLLEAISQNDHKPAFDRGREIFAEAQCYRCHRVGIQGGILGPDLTRVGGRYSVKDILVSIVDPNLEVSDQYAASQFLTDDGNIIIGRVINNNNKSMSIMTDMLDPSSLTSLQREAIESTRPSPTSMMPTGLVDTFTAEEIADLVAYLRAGGDAEHEVYQQP